MRKSLSFYLIIVLAIFACGPDIVAADEAAPASKVDATPVSDSEYRIGRDNVLQLDLYSPRGDKVTQTVRVSGSGFIAFPYVGEVAVNGLTISQAQEKIKGLLSKGDFSSNEVIITVQEFSPVSILGEVNKPGVFPFKGRLSLLELVALAGGFTNVASFDGIKVISTAPDGSKSERTVRVSGSVNGADAAIDASLMLRAGDVVFVPGSTVTIMGEVNKPGVYPTRGELTAVELIALAEGFTKFGSGSEVRVFRHGPDGKIERKIVRVKEIINQGGGEGDDLQLLSGDLVVVP